MATEGMIEVSRMHLALFKGVIEGAAVAMHRKGMAEADVLVDQHQDFFDPLLEELGLDGYHHLEENGIDLNT